MIVTAGTLRKAVEVTLKAHLSNALTIIGDAEGISLPAVKSWLRLADFSDLTEHDSPTIVVTVSGMTGAPERYSTDSEDVSWVVRVFVVVRGQTYEQTADRVAGYVAAVRGTLNTYPSLNGLASSARQTGEDYAELNRSSARTIGAGSVTFVYQVPSDRRVPAVPETPVLSATAVFDLEATGGPVA